MILGNRTVEPFSELGILGPNLLLGDYPSTLLVGEEFDLYLYLGNHEGETSYYRVYVVLGDQSLNVSDIESYSGQLLDTYDHVLLDDTNYTRPITLAINEPGINRRLVFELRKFHDNSFRYDGIWTQLWVNVTNPQ